MNYIEVNENGKVNFIHYLPFDEVEGLGKTEEELLETGFLLDEIPEPEGIEGKNAIAYYTAEKGFWYEYVDIPVDPSVVGNFITEEELSEAYLKGVNSL